MFKTFGTTGITRKRLLCRALAALLLLTLWPALPDAVPPAAALAYPDTIPESSGFTQRGSDTMGLTLPAQNAPLPLTYGQGADRTAWAFAAANVLEKAAELSFGAARSFSANHMRYALSSDGGNVHGFSRGYTEAGSRAQVAAYLMRGVMNGPVYTAADPYAPGRSAPVVRRRGWGSDVSRAAFPRPL